MATANLQQGPQLAVAKLTSELIEIPQQSRGTNWRRNLQAYATAEICIRLNEVFPTT